MEKIEIPFGAHDSELKGWEYTIPDGMEAEIKDGKIIVKEKESEDERMIKAITYILYENYTDAAVIEGVEIAEIVTWLEKQKERGPLTKEEEYILYRIIEFLEDETCPSEWISLLHDIYCLPYEKQKENPKSVDSIPSDCVSDVKCEDRSPKHTDSFGTDIRDTPAYWRGWDDAMKQKEQKPAEWSEEDKRKLNRIYEILGYAADDKGFLTSKRIIGDKEAIELQDFLKSLSSRPKLSDNWKPSEEQMEALEYVIRDYREDSCNATANYLQEILDHLKNM